MMLRHLCEFEFGDTVHRRDDDTEYRVLAHHPETGETTIIGPSGEERRPSLGEGAEFWMSPDEEWEPDPVCLEGQCTSCMAGYRQFLRIKDNPHGYEAQTYAGHYKAEQWTDYPTLTPVQRLQRKLYHSRPVSGEKGWMAIVARRDRQRQRYQEQAKNSRGTTPSPATVKRVDLDGNVTNTYRTEAELNGWRATQGALFDRDAYKPKAAPDPRQIALICEDAGQNDA